MRKLKSAVEKWQSLFGLGAYKIYLSLVDRLEEGDSHGEGYIEAYCHPHPEIYSAVLQFSQLSFDDPLEILTEEGLSVLAAHELFHVVIQEELLTVVEEILKMAKLERSVKNMFSKRLEDGAERITRRLEPTFRKARVTA